MMTSRRALTLLELLVVVGLLAVLVGLLVPAVQKVREAAARIATGNRLRQVGLALHNHLSAHGDRLPGWRAEDDPAYPGEPALQQLLPLIDARAVRTIDEVEVPTAFYNPTDPSYTARSPNAADTSVACNMLVFEGCRSVATHCADGLANTAAFTERYAQCQRTWPTGAVTAAILGSGILRSSSSTPVPSAAWSGSRRATFADRFYGDLTPASPLVATLPPFQTAPDPVGGCDGRLPQTPHTALTVGLADGSTRTVRPQVDRAAFWAAVTPAGGETFGLD